MKLKRLTVAKNWAKMHKKPLLIAGAVLSVILVIFIFVRIFSSDSVERTEPNATIEEAKEKTYSPLSGAEVSPKQAKRPVTSVVIENSPEARPQSGLKQSDLVFEAIAEGGITRFIAFYQESQPELIGPVRSLRPYFVDWVQTYDASIAHVGGSADALAEVQQFGLKDLDQFTNSQYYWRTSDRYAPHNVYTDFEQLDAANAAKGFDSSSFDSLPRKDGSPRTTPKASQISVNVSSYLYQSDYTYDKSTNSYARFQGGEPHEDREKGQIKPSSIVVLKVPNSIVDGFRYAYELVGSGEAFVFQNGNATKATWSRDSREAQFKLKNKNGKEIELVRGQTWFTAIGPEKSVTWTP